MNILTLDFFMPKITHRKLFNMSKPYPVIFRLHTVTTESWGDVDVSTYQLRFYDGSIKFETALFWSMDDANPNDPGSTVVATTFDGSRWAEINHAHWVNPKMIDIKIHQIIENLRKEQ